MIKNLKLPIVFIILYFNSFYLVKAQYMLREADAEYQLFNYKKAIDLYEQAYQKKATLYAAERLGECYALTADYKQTESWYAIASKMDGSKPSDMLAYAKALQQNAKYAEAKAVYLNYTKLNQSVSGTEKNVWLSSCDSALAWMKNPVKITLNNLQAINSPQSDWGGWLDQNNLTFASDRGNVDENRGTGNPFLKFDGVKQPDKQTYGWTGNAYFKLYTTHDNVNIQLFPVDANTQYHVGPASFTADGNEMYFTLTKIPSKPVYFNGKLATVNVEIYSSKKDKTGKWQVPVAFKYNKVNDYSVGDPFISKDGNHLYFVSNMSGGKGGTDMYVCHKNNSGEWESPVNLADINTAGDERTPFINPDGHFYFSSNGRIGMGGLDMFKCELNSGKFGTPENLGYPFNSPQDDFAYFQSDLQSGFFSSNRSDGMGSDDIYSFKLNQQFSLKLVGKVMDKVSHQPLSNAITTLKKINGQRLKVQTDESGRFKFDLEKDAEYDLTAEKTGFRSDIAKVSTVNLTNNKEIEKDLYLEQIVVDKAIRLENIYYDFDKFNIRPDAATELDKLVRIMKENPTIWIELGSHTDSRGNDQYNQWLSQQRANAAVKYIIERGVNRNRITAKGYGESKLLNQCANGVKCSAAEHQLNRRTEFKITKQ